MGGGGLLGLGLLLGACPEVRLDTCTDEGRLEEGGEDFIDFFRREGATGEECSSFLDDCTWLFPSLVGGVLRREELRKTLPRGGGFGLGEVALDGDTSSWCDEQEEDVEVLDARQSLPLLLEAVGRRRRKTHPLARL